MASQDGLKQVGLEVDVVVDEPMVQHTAMQVDHPPQPDPEVVMGAVGAAAQERPLRQISPSVPSETATNRGGSASLEPSGIEQLVRMI